MLELKREWKRQARELVQAERQVSENLREELATVRAENERLKRASLPPVPHSPVSGRTLATSNFKAAYAKASAPADLMDLGSTLGRMLEAYCIQHTIPFDGDEGAQFFSGLRDEMDGADTVSEAVQRMWTSFQTLRGREFCFILNQVARDDIQERMGPAATLTRAINELCVTAGVTGHSAVHPADNVCFRGGGFDMKYRSFFVEGREFRQPAYLATSFSEETANGFIERAAASGVDSCARWIVQIDPELKCAHVNLLTKRVPNLPDEKEYLFAPYSAFEVLSAAWNAGTAGDPHVIELRAAPDNKGVPEDLPLAPWS
jgi:hypothetical protein